MFMTDYQSFKWYWMSRSVECATIAEELQDDIDLENYRLSKEGENRSIIELKPSFKGFQSISSPTEIIKFNQEELVHFD
jgi:hypothetical protein